VVTNISWYKGDSTVVVQPPVPTSTPLPYPPPSPPPTPAPTTAPPPSPTPPPGLTYYFHTDANAGNTDLLYDYINDKLITDSSDIWYNSTDNSASWVGLVTGIRTALAIDVSQSGITLALIYNDYYKAGTNFREYFVSRSVDGGSTFSFGVHFYDDDGTAPVNKIAWTGGNNWIVYSDTNAVGYISTDNGQSWTPFACAIGASVTTCSTVNNVVGSFIALSPATAYVSIDGGLTYIPLALPVTKNWTTLNSANNWVMALAPDTVLVADPTAALFHYSTPITVHQWTKYPQYIAGVWYIAAGPNDVITPGDEGIYYSTDNGQTWAKQVNVIPATGAVNWLAQRATRSSSYVILVTGKKFLASPLPVPAPTPSPTPSPLMAITQTFSPTAGQTVFNLTLFTYTPGLNQLQVFVNGVYQNPTNYTESTSSRVTLGFSTLQVGDVVDICKVA
jgi:hypothetical protein